MTDIKKDVKEIAQELSDLLAKKILNVQGKSSHKFKVYENVITNFVGFELARIALGFNQQPFQLITRMIDPLERCAMKNYEELKKCPNKLKM